MLTEWLWGYRSTDPRIHYRENFFNILLLVPIGFLVGLIVSRYKLIKAVLFGLFMSETIECSQLVWHREHLMLTACSSMLLDLLVGGLIAVTVLWIRQLIKNHEQSVQ